MKNVDIAKRLNAVAIQITLEAYDRYNLASYEEIVTILMTDYEKYIAGKKEVNAFGAENATIIPIKDLVLGREKVDGVLDITFITEADFIENIGTLSSSGTYLKDYLFDYNKDDSTYVEISNNLDTYLSGLDYKEGMFIKVPKSKMDAVQRVLRELEII